MLHEEVFGDDRAGQAPDAPFKIFSMEILGQSITVPRPGDEPVSLECIMLVETEPRVFLSFSLVSVRGERMVVSSMSNESNGLVTDLLDRLKREATGVEHTRERVKLGAGHHKRVATFRRVVHVRPKSQTSTSSVPGTRAIDWTHRWAVRGHWREIKGLGKDRDGNYCVENMTWVSEYEKGPEDAPLVKKTRVVGG